MIACVHASLCACVCVHMCVYMCVRALACACLLCVYGSHRDYAQVDEKILYLKCELCNENQK